VGVRRIFVRSKVLPKLFLTANEYVLIPTCRTSPKRGLDGEYISNPPLLNGISLLQPRIPLGEWKNGPHTIINYVRRTFLPVVLKCASEDAQFGADEYIVEKNAKSIICMPILLKNIIKVLVISLKIHKTFEYFPRMLTRNRELCT
jgi:hypothetical protein